MDSINWFGLFGVFFYWIPVVSNGWLTLVDLRDMYTVDKVRSSTAIPELTIGTLLWGFCITFVPALNAILFYAITLWLIVAKVQLKFMNIGVVRRTDDKDNE